MNTDTTVERAGLKTVHELFAKEAYQEALQLLEKLAKDHPEFALYRTKLGECKKKLAAAALKSQHPKQVPSLGNVKEKMPQQSEPATLIDQNILEEGRKLARAGDTGQAIKILSELYKNRPELPLLMELARIDLVDERYADALYKAKASIAKDPNFRDAYRIAEQAAIELGQYEEANSFFLMQPPIVNPPEPRKRGANPTLPPQLKIPPIIGAGNNYEHILEKATLFVAANKPYTKTISIIVPVYNRHKILANTLAALIHQTYPSSLMEIIVVDDGSNDEVFEVIKKYENRINLYYARQPDSGYRLAAARNIGLKLSSGDSIAFMDADILPLPTDIENYMRVLHVSDQVVLIGHRRYVDVSNITDDDILKDINAAITLPNINPDNDVADRKNADGVSIDWRFPEYKKTNYLIDDMWPFTKAAGGNIAFSRRLLEAAGFVDEEFTAWGCEDGEHGYRLYNAGAYFIPMMNIVSLHQEPMDENKAPTIPSQGESFRAIGHKITKEIFSKKCPAPSVRKNVPGAKFDVPKVSIYIPAYNSERYIVQAVNSCLSQNFDDLEVCICDDGSTDGTLKLIEKNYSGSKKVRWTTQRNSGIGKATNTAIDMCRGMYIGQLDSDDILKPNAVRTCVSLLDTRDIDGVHADCDYIDGEGKYIRDGWCGGDFSRDWMATGMIATHFRMFRRRVWARTEHCNETIKNAVDLDLWLKIYEKGRIEHIHQILYSYRWHGQNTSITHRKAQEANHLKVVADSLKRQGLDRFWAVQSTHNRLNPREFKIVSNAQSKPVIPSDVFFLIPSCAKYADKCDAVRHTWAKRLTARGFRYLFLMGKPDLEIARVEGDVLYVPCKDDYESLLLKLVMGYQFLYRNADFSHVYKIDDDCYLNLDKLVGEILPQLDAVQYAGGATHPKGAKMNNRWHFGKCSDERFDKPYRFDVAPFEFAKGGYGYFLRRDVLPILFERINSFKQELGECIYSYEDVRIAELLIEYGIVPTKLAGYSVCPSTTGEVESNMLLIYDIKDAKTLYTYEKTKLRGVN